MFSRLKCTASSSISKWRSRSVARHWTSPNLQPRLHSVAEERLQLLRRLVIDCVRGVVDARVGKDASHVRVEDLERDVVGLPVEPPRNSFQVCKRCV